MTIKEMQIQFAGPAKEALRSLWANRPPKGLSFEELDALQRHSFIRVTLWYWDVRTDRWIQGQVFHVTRFRLPAFYRWANNFSQRARAKRKEIYTRIA
jgi:hypothetical protein